MQSLQTRRIDGVASVNGALVERQPESGDFLAIAAGCP
jgi:hypothetical protein